jgi:hypothetical protein
MKPKTNHVLKVPGWGADLNVKNRPGIPRERTRPSSRKQSKVKTLQMKPISGNTYPPRGISGKVRKMAYRFNEESISRWTTLLFADRIDVFENILADIFKGRFVNPISEMGLRAELKTPHLGRLKRSRSQKSKIIPEVVTASGITLFSLGTLIGLIRQLKTKV